MYKLKLSKVFLSSYWIEMQFNEGFESFIRIFESNRKGNEAKLPKKLFPRPRLYVCQAENCGSSKYIRSKRKSHRSGVLKLS